jgi:hypothetical protein
MDPEPAPSPTPPPVKILVVADVAGRHKDLFTAVKKAHSGKAGPFSALFCVGKFFAESDNSDAELLEFVEGRDVVPLPTYFICGDEAARRSSTLVDNFDNNNNSNSEEDDTRESARGHELCANLFYLGKGGRKDVAGLSVAYLGGTFDANIFSAGPAASLARGRYSEELVR